MHRLGDRLPTLHVLGRVDAGVLQPPVGELVIDGGAFNDDEPCVLGPLLIVRQVDIRWRAIEFGTSAGQRRHGDAVPER